MAREFARTDRVADAIQRILATAIAQEVRDPRVGMVNINDVTVTRDMAHAKVFVTFVGKGSTDDENNSECEKSLEVLNHASGFLRGVVAKELNMRVTPRLHFVYDQTSIRGQQLSSLIDKAIAEDATHSDDTESGSE